MERVMSPQTFDIEMTFDEYLAALVNGSGAWGPDCARLIIGVLVSLELVICESGNFTRDDGTLVRTEDFKATEELKERMDKLGEFVERGRVLDGGDPGSLVH
jgi:hypothetical protein